MQRDLAPDVLRGFALLGILVVNIQFMGLNSDQGHAGSGLKDLPMVQQPFSLQHSLPESFTYCFLFSSATAQTM
jgi:uncharacterized membrane protein YeiB